MFLRNQCSTFKLYFFLQNPFAGFGAGFGPDQPAGPPLRPPQPVITGNYVSVVEPPPEFEISRPKPPRDPFARRKKKEPNTTTGATTTPTSSNSSRPPPYPPLRHIQVKINQRSLKNFFIYHALSIY